MRKLCVLSAPFVYTLSSNFLNACVHKFESKHQMVVPSKLCVHSNLSQQPLYLTSLDCSLSSQVCHRLS